MTKYTIYRITTGEYHSIGSTKDFNQRKSQHRGNCGTRVLPLYTMINANGGWANCSMVPIEELDCERRIAALIREEYWRRQYVNTLNVNQAYVSEEERSDRRKVSNAKLNAVWAPKRCLDYIQCECGGEYQAHCKTAHNRGKRHGVFVLEALALGDVEYQI
jgi:hypothetical protein